MTICAHPNTLPVEVVVDRIAMGLGDMDAWQVVARICTSCFVKLPACWGCTDCEWVETQTLCELVPTRDLARPCPAHTGGNPA